MRSPSRPRVSSCRTSPACPASSIWPRCAKRSCGSAATPQRVNPLSPAELVIDHSVQVDQYGTPEALAANTAIEFSRNRRALRVPALGPDRVPQFQGGAAEHRHRPPGQSRVSRSRDLRCRGGRCAQRVPRHTGRHRFAHHHGQRAGRARLGCRRHRGGSRHARPAGDHADPAGGRLSTSRAGCSRAPRRPTWCSRSRRSCARRVWSTSSWSSSATDSITCRSPTAPPSPTCRPSTAAPARSSRSMRRRCVISSSPAGRASAWIWSAPMPALRGCGASGAPARRAIATNCELDLGKVEPSLAGPRRPQDRVPLQVREADLRDRCRQGRGRAPRAEILGHGSRRRDARRRARRHQGRRGADRGDHELHQHLEPHGHAGGRTAGAQSAGARPHRASRG